MRMTWIPALAALFIMPSMALAQRGPDRGPGGPGDGRRGGPDWQSMWTDPAQREEMYKRIEERVGPERAAEFRERMETEMKRRFDSDGDGEVTQGEIDRAMEQQRAEREQRMTEWRERQEIRRWDTDGDGELSAEEKAKKEAAEKAEAEALKAQIAAVTKEYDTDGNGELSADEIKVMREKVQKMLADVQQIETVARAKAEQGDRSMDALADAIRDARRGGGDRGRGGDRNDGPSTTARPAPSRPGGLVDGEPSADTPRPRRPLTAE